MVLNLNSMIQYHCIQKLVLGQAIVLVQTTECTFAPTFFKTPLIYTMYILYFFNIKKKKKTILTKKI